MPKTSQTFKISLEAPKGDSHKIFPGDLMPPPFNRKVTQEAVEVMALGLLRDGQIHDIAIRKEVGGVNDKRPIVIFGDTRRKAGVLINENKLTYDKATDALVSSPDTFKPYFLRATYWQVSPEQAAILQFQENNPDTRNDLSAVEVAEQIANMKRAFSWNDSTVARLLGKTPSWICGLNTVSQLDGRTQDALRTGVIKFDTAIGPIAAIAVEDRPAVIAEAVAADPKGKKATKAAVVKAIEKLGIVAAKKTARTAADWKGYVNSKLDTLPEGAVKNFFFGVQDWQANGITTAELDALVAALSQAAPVANGKASKAA